MKAYIEGPWEIGIDELGEQLPGFVPINANRHGSLALVVWVMEDDKRTPECEANAQLIAAAPDLLEALIDMVAIAQLDKWDQAVSGRQSFLWNAKVAIAKARGE